MPMSAPAPPPGPPPRDQIQGPLDSLAKILYDDDITDLISNAAGKDANELALQIWQDYGGNEKGSVDNGKTGTRSGEEDGEGPDTPDADKLRHATKDEKWKRLPQGKTIADITSLDELSKIMSGLILGATKNSAQQSAAGGGKKPGGPGGGGPPPGGGGPPPPDAGGPPGGGMGGPPPGMPPGAASIHNARFMARLARVLDSQGCPRAADWIDRQVWR